LNFAQIVGTRKLVPGPSGGVVCLIRLAVLVEHQLVIERKDRQTDIRRQLIPSQASVALVNYQLIKIIKILAYSAVSEIISLSLASFSTRPLVRSVGY